MNVTSETYNGALAAGASTSIGFTGTVGTTDNVRTYSTIRGSYGRA